jgi:quinoprotein glucose dehydrogenase
MRKYIFSGILLSCSVFLACNSKNSASKEWTEYLGGPDRNHYSILTQIDSSNVKQLKVAWEYHTKSPGQIQCNPIIVNGRLYGMTATTEPFAIDAATGKEIWRVKSAGTDQFSTSRGVTYWENGDDKRILYTNGPWLYAVDAITGKSISTFGQNGRVSLKEGLGETAKLKMVISNTPGALYKDLIIMPLRVSEGTDAAMGFIQAFNVVTGKLTWVFHTIPLPGEYGYDTWPKDVYKNTNVGAGNCWPGMAVDRERGIIYAPTGSAAFDFYGEPRKGTNLFANCLLALDANTGKRIWHYQFVHHDVLDRDPPAPPNLVTVMHDGKKVDAVVQVTKQGRVFVFDRVNGTPLFPVDETKVPQSDIPGEHTWATQPLPQIPAPYARQNFTIDDISPLASNRQELIDSFKKSRSEGPFTPLSKHGTIIYPGLDGGAEWGGAAADPNGILYVNSSEMAWRISIGPSVSKNQLVSMSAGQAIYSMNCTPCHGGDRKGSPASGYPSLIDIQKKRTKQSIEDQITHGRGMMPGFPKLTQKDKDAVVGFLFGKEEPEPGLVKEPGLTPKVSDPEKPNYQMSGYTKFLDKNGYPAVRPPWGTLNAINLNTGAYVWKVTYGTYPELLAKGIPQTGSESYGGPVITKSGLLFISGTKDAMFRAYDMKTGKLLWQTKLPAAAFATPSTYEVNGKQYIAIACGGTKLGAPQGDSYIAFALP